MLLVCHVATSCVVMPPAISCILLAIMFGAMPLFSVFVVVLFATTCVALPSAIPRSTLSDIVCFNASCPWYSLVLPFATTCVAMSPAMFSSTSSYHLCCDALCYISVFLAITCVANFSFWILASCVRRALPHPLLMLALQCAIPLLPHAFMDRLRTCVSPMPLPLMYQLWYTPHISHLTLYTYISHFTFHTSHLRISACQEEFPDLQVARKRLQSARK